MRQAGFIFWCCVLWAHSLPAVQALPLDIYFEESHAGTFYHLAATLPPEEPHTLVLIDAHSDASAIADSDRMREAIRKVPTAEARGELFARWRKSGMVQCYDWLEPLMPAPIDQVLWVAAPSLNPIEIGRKQTLARESLDGLLEAFPRECGELGARYRTVDWKGFEKERAKWTREAAVVVSLDLDYFATVPDGKLDAEFERVFAGILEVPGLRAVTMCLSAPWQRGEAQRERLTALAVSAATSVGNARVHFAPFAEAGEDRSRRAKELREQGKAVPRLDVAQAGLGLKSVLLAKRRRLGGDKRLETLLEAWAVEPFLPHIAVEGEIAEPDGWHRLRAGGEFRVHCERHDGAKVRWFALVPQHVSTNVAGLRLGFAEDAPRWLRRRPLALGEGTELPAKALRAVLEPVTQAGSAIVYATIERDGEIIQSNELRLAIRVEGGGFRGALSEEFARPYAFGCGLLALGPDGLVANDCANFLVAAIRREGWRMPWCNPKQFSEYGRELGAWKQGGAWPALPDGAAGQGTFIHFGNHMAALWEDRAPLGQLDGGDLVAHHLENVPEIVPLEELLRTRGQFRVMQLNPQEAAVRLVFGGDVMLGRRVGETIEQGRNPLARLRERLSAADFAVVNLECVASAQGEAVAGRRFHFRAHPNAPGLLKEAGVDVVSLANNHARDFGDAAFGDAAERLRGAGLRVADGSPQAVRVEAGGLRLAIFACEDSMPEEGLAAIREAAREATVIVLTHWGTEHWGEPDEGQRELAGELIKAGARVIAGSGPHTRQPMVFQDGAVVAWSLGNLVFDGPGPDLGWSRGALLEVEFAKSGRIVRAREVPVRIGEDGMAEADASAR